MCLFVEKLLSVFFKKKYALADQKVLKRTVPLCIMVVATLTTVIVIIVIITIISVTAILG